MGKKILIVRTSSLGDLVHMLPAMSDIAHHVPDAEIDWIVEDSFTEIPAWHPAIREVIPIAHRRWRKHWWSTDTRAARRALRANLDARHYDMVLDMQGLMKSIWLVRQTHGERHGLDRASVREPMASWFYDVRHTVEFWQPAIIRQRTLASLALGYQYQGTPDYGLQQFTEGTHVQPCAVIMPSASRPDKLWPEEDWREVFKNLLDRGLSLQLLAGNASEVARARQLVGDLPRAEVLPTMNLTAVAEVLARAQLMIGLDSGLTHLSAALSRPTIGIYIASTPVRTPLVSTAYTASLGERGNPPSAQTVLAAIDQALKPGLPALAQNGGMVSTYGP